MEKLVAKRYAKALSSTSLNLTDILEVLNPLSQVVQTQEVKTTLTSPIISKEQKIEMILSSIETTVDAIKNFIKILGENSRLELIPEITLVLNQEQQKALNVYNGIVKSSTPLSEETLTKLQETLKSYTGSTITLKQEEASVDGILVLVEDLGIEVNFSKERVKEQLIDFIKKSL